LVFPLDGSDLEFVIEGGALAVVCSFETGRSGLGLVQDVVKRQAAVAQYRETRMMEFIVFGNRAT